MILVHTNIIMSPFEAQRLLWIWYQHTSESMSRFEANMKPSRDSYQYEVWYQHTSISISPFEANMIPGRDSYEYDKYNMIPIPGKNHDFLSLWPANYRVILCNSGRYFSATARRVQMGQTQRDACICGNILTRPFQQPSFPFYVPAPPVYTWRSLRELDNQGTYRFLFLSFVGGHRNWRSR